MHSEKRTRSAETCPRVSRPLTSDVFLFRSALFGVGGLLDVNYQLALRFVLVNWPGWIVDFIVLIRVRSWAAAPSRRPPRGAELVWEIGGSMDNLHRYKKESGVVEVTN